MPTTFQDIVNILKYELSDDIEEGITNILESSISMIFLSLPDYTDADVLTYIAGTSSPLKNTISIIDTSFTENEKSKCSVSVGTAKYGNSTISTGVFNLAAFMSNAGDKSITGKNVGQVSNNSTLSLSSRFILKDSGIQVIYYGPNGICLEHDYTFVKKRGDQNNGTAYKYMHVLRTRQVILSRLRNALRGYIGSTEDTVPDISTILISSLNDLTQINTIDYEVELQFVAGTLNLLLNIELANELSFKVLVGV